MNANRKPKDIDYYVLAEARTGRRLTRDEVFPWMDDGSHCATFDSFADAEVARVNYVRANSTVGLKTELVILGCDPQGKVMTLNGRPAGKFVSHPCCRRNPLLEDTTCNHRPLTDTAIQPALNIVENHHGRDRRSPPPGDEPR